jgi:hypothetical protein
MMKRLIFIHSHDSTTEFLEGIILFLMGKGYTNFEHIKIVCAAENAEEARNTIANANHGSTIVFLGHGASHCVYLPYPESQAAEFFINKSNFEILQGKNFICLACRSAEFVRHNFQPADGTAMIGFGDLPTDWQDIYSEHEMGDHTAYAGITGEVLAHFRRLLVDIFAKSLCDAVSNKMNFNQFYLRLRLYTNRSLFQVTNYSISDNPTLLANILFEFKTGTQLLGNTSSLIL